MELKLVNESKSIYTRGVKFSYNIPNAQTGDDTRNQCMNEQTNLVFPPWSVNGREQAVVVGGRDKTHVSIFLCRLHSEFQH